MPELRGDGVESLDAGADGGVDHRGDHEHVDFGEVVGGDRVDQETGFTEVVDDSGDVVTVEVVAGSVADLRRLTQYIIRIAEEAYLQDVELHQ